MTINTKVTTIIDPSTKYAQYEVHWVTSGPLILIGKIGVGKDHRGNDLFVAKTLEPWGPAIGPFDISDTLDGAVKHITDRVAVHEEAQP